MPQIKLNLPPNFISVIYLFILFRMKNKFFRKEIKNFNVKIKKLTINKFELNTVILIL